MNHQDALQEMAVERYLLGELSGAALDRFEEHLFECPQCATDVRAGATFIDAARDEFKVSARVSAPEKERSPTWLSWLASPRFLAPALAACLAVIAVQSFVVLPRMRMAEERAEAPAILNSLVLANAGARGDSVAEIVAPEHGSFLISVDIPARSGFSSYLCSLYSPSGSLVWQTTVLRQQVSDALLIHMPTDRTKEGLNTFLVQGSPAVDGSSGKLEDLARYRFQLKVSK
jgi:hypothetical protein